MHVVISCIMTKRIETEYITQMDISKFSMMLLYKGEKELESGRKTQGGEASVG